MLKKMLGGVCFMAGCGFLLLALGAGHPGGPTATPNNRIAKGQAIAPVSLRLQGHSVREVYRGSYIVNAVAGCNDCHSCPSYAPGHNPYEGTGDGEINAANYLAGGVNFGVAVSPNLTPDASGRPAGLTRDEFFQAMREGHAPQSTTAVLQVMPWPIYRNMIDTDLNSIYEYLSAIPPAEPGTCSGPGE